MKKIQLTEVNIMVKKKENTSLWELRENGSNKQPNSLNNAINLSSICHD